MGSDFEEKIVFAFENGKAAIHLILDHMTAYVQVFAATK